MGKWTVITEELILNLPKIKYLSKINCIIILQKWKQSEEHNNIMKIQLFHCKTEINVNT